MTTAAPASTRTPGRAWRAVRSGFGASLLTGIASTLVALTIAGTPGAWGAALGASLVVGFFAVGAAVLTVFRDVPPAALLVIALLTYALQAVALLAVYAAFVRHPAWAEAVSTRALGLTTLACTLAHSAGLIAALRTSRTPVFDAGGQTP